MPSDIILVDYDRLASVATNFNTQGESVKKLLTRISDETSHLRTSWIADSATSFYRDMEVDVLPGLDRLAKAILKASDTTTDIGKVFAQAEAEAVQLLNLNGGGGGTETKLVIEPLSETFTEESSTSTAQLPNKTMDVSQTGLARLKLLEGTKTDKKGNFIVYKDQANKDTIGYGHLITDEEKEAGTFKKGLTKADAEELLRADVQAHADIIRDNVKVPLNENQFDALMSFSFNTGPNGFKNSTLLEKLNAGDYAAVPGEMKKWIYITPVDEDGESLPKEISKGLQNRRNSEAKLFDTPVIIPPGYFL